MRSAPAVMVRGYVPLRPMFWANGFKRCDDSQWKCKEMKYIIAIFNLDLL